MMGHDMMDNAGGWWGMMGHHAAFCQQMMQRCVAGDGSCPMFEAAPENTPASS
jgi:hypothetical protein